MLPSIETSIFIDNAGGESGHGKDKEESQPAFGVTAARKLAAAQKRASRKAARRDRLFSESATTEYPTKSILKYRPPVKRSVSECIDDISHIMDDLSLESSNPTDSLNCQPNNLSSDGDGTKKSVRFNEEVYETVFIASRLYDRGNFSKYHFSTRHHPPLNQTKKNSRKKGGGDNEKKKKGTSSKSKNKKKTLSESSDGYTDTSSDDQSSGQEDNASTSDSEQCNGDSYVDIQSSLGNKMSKHNRRENREKKSINFHLVQHCSNKDNNDDIFGSNVTADDRSNDIRSSDYLTTNGLSKQKEENSGIVSTQSPRRLAIDSGYDSTEEENLAPWTTVRRGRKCQFKSTS